MVPYTNQFLIDNEEGMKVLLTWCRNLLMQIEAPEQAGAEYYKKTENPEWLSEWVPRAIVEDPNGDLTLKNTSISRYSN